jgi:putative photosynthetic complex assembly protein
MMASAVQPFPRLPLMGVIALVCVAVVGVSAARLAGFQAAAPMFSEAPAESRLLRFEDRPDGGVGVIDAKTDQDIAVARPGTNGFLRGALRGLMRTRKRQGIAQTELFRVERFASGQIVLTDMATATNIPLNAFGPTNAAVFAAFLSTPEGGSK